MSKKYRQGWLEGKKNIIIQIKKQKKGDTQKKSKTNIIKTESFQMTDTKRKWNFCLFFFFLNLWGGQERREGWYFYFFYLFYFIFLHHIYIYLIFIYINIYETNQQYTQVARNLMVKYIYRWVYTSDIP